MDFMSPTFTPYHTWETLRGFCDIAIRMNFSDETRLDMLLDILDYEVYTAKMSSIPLPRTPTGAVEVGVPKTEASFKRLFAVQLDGNVLNCMPLREFKQRMRERGYMAVGFTFDSARWVVIVK